MQNVFFFCHGVVATSETSTTLLPIPKAPGACWLPSSRTEETNASSSFIGLRFEEILRHDFHWYHTTVVTQYCEEGVRVHCNPGPCYSSVPLHNISTWPHFTNTLTSAKWCETCRWLDVSRCCINHTECTAGHKIIYCRSWISNIHVLHLNWHQLITAHWLINFRQIENHYANRVLLNNIRSWNHQHNLLTSTMSYINRRRNCDVSNHI